MRKEILIAIMLGTFFGIILAFGIWRANFALKEGVEGEGNIPEKEQEKKPSSEFKISLTSPENNDVVTESPILVAGITKGQNWTVISSNDEDIIAKTESAGTFEEEIELEGGVNQIILYSLEEGDGSTQKTLTLVYSSEFKKYIDTEDEGETEEESMEEKINQKVESAKKNSKAFIGTLTDITEDTFQIKNLTDEIQQISLSDDVDYVSINKTTKTINFEDVAIGDFVVAMGFINGDEVLEAKRVLITEPLEKPIRKIVYGTVKEIVKKDITIEDNDQEQYSLTFPRRWKGPEISELEEDMKVLVVCKPDKDDLIIRTIKIVPS